jgi:hypothetical protein
MTTLNDAKPGVHVLLCDVGKGLTCDDKRACAILRGVASRRRFLHRNQGSSRNVTSFSNLSLHGMKTPIFFSILSSRI